MADLTPERVREARRTGRFPNLRRDIVTLGMVGEDIAIAGDTVRLHVRPGTDRPETLQQLARAIDAALRRLPGVVHVDVHFARAEEGRGRDPFTERAALPGVAHIVAVASAKGGGGKSTVAVNMALGLPGAGRWRGRMVRGLERHVRRSVVWGDIEFRVLAVPPGTCNGPLRLVQWVRGIGAVIGTRSRNVALQDTGWSMRMFLQVITPVLGVF